MRFQTRKLHEASLAILRVDHDEPIDLAVFVLGRLVKVTLQLDYFCKPNLFTLDGDSLKNNGANSAI